MKDLRILALATMLALGFSLSARAQTDNTTGSDQYTTQSTDQATTQSADPNYSARAASDNNSMFTQQSPQQGQSTSMSTYMDTDSSRQFWSDQVNSDEKLQELRNDSGAN